jgi:hypothetical protein
VGDCWQHAGGGYEGTGLAGGVLEVGKRGMEAWGPTGGAREVGGAGGAREVGGAGGVAVEDARRPKQRKTAVTS